MKWTDTMVRLLITVVYCVEDEGGGGVAEGGDHHHPSSGKANSSTNNNNNNVKKVGSAQQQQKKGKWKSVSRAMLERGYYVSPQQCEDKFNDLNKRYKRVNELLGRGTACRVVENQALLDTMDLFPKAKEEARKLLNSKHLFFREMCAYHNSGSSCAPSLLPPPPAPQPPPDQLQSQQQHLHCLHHPPGDGGAADRDENHPDDDEDDMEHEDEDDDNYEDEDDVDDVEEDEDHDNKHGQHHQRHRHEEGDEDEDSKGFMAAVTSNAWSGVKRPRKKSLPSSASPPMSLSLSSPPSSVSMQQLRCELMGMAAGGGEQQRQWLRRRASELEEHRMGYQRRALELERQRFKWLRFSGNKEREMERMKLENERLRLDNERMLLLLRRKELELISVGEGGASSSAPTADPHHQQPNARRLGEYYSTAPSGGEHVSNAAG